MGPMVECPYCGARDEQQSRCCFNVQRLWRDNSTLVEQQRQSLAAQDAFISKIQELEEKLAQLQKEKESLK